MSEEVAEELPAALRGVSVAAGVRTEVRGVATLAGYDYTGIFAVYIV